jgi:hypothetical protein
VGAASMRMSGVGRPTYTGKVQAPHASDAPPRLAGDAHAAPVMPPLMPPLMSTAMPRVMYGPEARR